MPWPFLYFAGDRLSLAELAGARLDGDVVEVGDAFMPADAVETPELRAGSLRRRVPDTLALIRESAAWVHGALPEAPGRHRVQRRSAVRLHHVLDIRLIYHDQPIAADAVVCLGGVWVTTPGRTLADLVRAREGGEDVEDLITAMLQWRPRIGHESLDDLARSGALRHKRPAMAHLRERLAWVPQDDVTR